MFLLGAFPPPGWNRVNINLWNIKKVFLVPYVIQCYPSNEFVREYSTLSEVIIPYVFFIIRSFQKQNLTGDDVIIT